MVRWAMSETHIAPRGPRLTLYESVSALPAPATVTDGVELTSPFTVGVVLPQLGQDAVQAVPPTAMIYIDSDAGEVVIPGPVQLRVSNGDGYYTLAHFGDGAAEIVVRPLEGWPERAYLPADAKYLAIVASGPIVGGAVTIKIQGEASL